MTDTTDPPAPVEDADDNTFTLHVGFPVEVPEDDAKAKAVADWHDACAVEGYAGVGDPCAVVIRDNPNRAAMGEYMVAVAGPRVAS